MSRIKTGIIGAGFIGPQHIEAIRRLGFVDVAAIAEADLDLANAIAGKMYIPTAYGSYQELWQTLRLKWCTTAPLTCCTTRSTAPYWQPVST